MANCEFWIGSSTKCVKINKRIGKRVCVTKYSRDQDIGITEEGQAGTDSAEVKEKFCKKGMMET